MIAYATTRSTIAPGRIALGVACYGVERRKRQRATGSGAPRTLPEEPIPYTVEGDRLVFTDRRGKRRELAITAEGRSIDLSRGPLALHWRGNKNRDAAKKGWMHVHVKCDECKRTSAVEVSDWTVRPYGCRSCVRKRSKGTLAPGHTDHTKPTVGYGQ